MASPSILSKHFGTWGKDEPAPPCPGQRLYEMYTYGLMVRGACIDHWPAYDDLALEVRYMLAAVEHAVDKHTGVVNTHPLEMRYP